jgi:hypothetical protein
MRPKSFNIVFFGCLAFALSGCQAVRPDWTKNWFGSNPKVQESKFETPAKMAAIWTPAVFNQPGQPPTRGLGGRLYFYDANNRPVAVEGQLVVYAYNDRTPDAAQRIPDRKYAFTPEQFTEHYSPTELGAAYSVWIPWDQVGQVETELSLVPVFTAAGGQLLMGQASKSLLPGPKPATAIAPPSSRPPLTLEGLLKGNAALQAQSAVQQASLQEAPPEGSRPPVAGMEAFSIQLPSGMAERMANAPPPESPSAQWSRQRAAQMAPMMAVQAQPPAQPTPATAGQASGAVIPPWPPAPSPPGRSELPRLQAPGLRAPPPTAGQTLRPPFHGGLPSAHSG